MWPLPPEAPFSRKGKARVSTRTRWVGGRAQSHITTCFKHSARWPKSYICFMGYDSLERGAKCPLFIPEGPQLQGICPGKRETLSSKIRNTCHTFCSSQVCKSIPGKLDTWHRSVWLDGIIVANLPDYCQILIVTPRIGVDHVLQLVFVLCSLHLVIKKNMLLF